MKKHEPQPAKVNYFFGDCWKDVGKFFRISWQETKEAIWKKKVDFERGKGIRSLEGAKDMLICLCVILFGCSAFFVVSILFSVISAVVLLVVYMAILVIWLLDRLFLLKNHIFVACPECKNKIPLPIYVCPSCGTQHTRLMPGKYGLLKRKCECGAKIPTHFLTGRGNLDAICPFCNKVLKGSESVPLMIPVVGGRSAGKTAFITAFSHDFIERIAPSKGIQVTHYSPDSERFYENEIHTDYINGTTRMTQTELDSRKASSKAFSFFVENNKLKPKRMIQLYDVDGESFVSHGENEVQQQYSYCHGVVLILDPLTMPDIRNALDDTVDDRDKNSVGTRDSDEVLDALTNLVREITGKKSTDMSKFPLAVVISKCDIQGVDEYVSDVKIKQTLAAKGLKPDAYMDVEDALCRKLLKEHGLSGLVSNVEMNFKNNRFFACSAIGHTRENGSYAPRGVNEPMEWIIGCADKGMGSAWNDTKFGARVEL